MSGTHSMICMLCDTAVTRPWEEEIEPVADAAGWLTLPKTPDRRRSPHSVCAACAWELAGMLGLMAVVDAAESIFWSKRDEQGVRCGLRPTEPKALALWNSLASLHSQIRT